MVMMQRYHHKVRRRALRWREEGSLAAGLLAVEGVFFMENDEKNRFKEEIYNRDTNQVRGGR
eukprot:765045-Hanusia_phi.AAC.1